MVIRVFNCLNCLVIFLQLLSKEVWSNVPGFQRSIFPLQSACCYQQDNVSGILFDFLGWRVFSLHLRHCWSSLGICLDFGYLFELAKINQETLVLENKVLHFKGIFIHLCTLSCNWRYQHKRGRFKVRDEILLLITRFFL